MGSTGPPLDPRDTLTATEQTGPPGEAESSPLTEFSDFFPTGGEEPIDLDSSPAPSYRMTSCNTPGVPSSPTTAK